MLKELYHVASFLSVRNLEYLLKYAKELRDYQVKESLTLASEDDLREELVFRPLKISLAEKKMAEEEAKKVATKKATTTKKA